LGGWSVFEEPGVEPVFLQKHQAIGYAECVPYAKAYSGSHPAVIRVYDDAGNVIVCLDQIASVIPRCSLANAAVGKAAIKSVIFTPP